MEPLLEEPSDDDHERRKRQAAFDAMLQDAERVLVVLPRRHGRRALAKPHWVGSVDSRQEESCAPLKRLGYPCHLKTVRAPISWRSEGLLPAEPELVRPRLLAHDGRIAPLVSTSSGDILLGHYDHNGADLYVLSDPDLLANHGLHRGSNAAVVAAIIERARGGRSGDVVIDELTHGWELPPSLLREMTEWPLVLLSAQLLLLALLIIWAGLLRFGRPRPLEEGLGAGNAVFISTTAELLRAGGHSAHNVERYIWLQLEHSARALHAPSELLSPSRRGDLVAWLEAQGLERGYPLDVAGLTDRAASYATGERRARLRQLLIMARRVHLWSKDVTDGPVTSPPTS